MSSHPTTPRPPIATQPHAGSVRDRNNLVVLLAATDPLDLIQQGHSAVDYATTASEVLDVLAAGGGVDEVFGLFLTAAERVEAVDDFTRAALTWWDGRQTA